MAFICLQGHLVPIFLFYCMLERAAFVRHWPPQLAYSGWLALMREVGSTNLVPGTRTRSDATMHVSAALLSPSCTRHAGAAVFTNLSLTLSWHALPCCC